MKLRNDDFYFDLYVKLDLTFVIGNLSFVKSKH